MPDDKKSEPPKTTTKVDAKSGTVTRTTVTETTVEVPIEDAIEYHAKTWGERMRRFCGDPRLSKDYAEFQLNEKSGKVVTVQLMLKRGMPATSGKKKGFLAALFADDAPKGKSKTGAAAVKPYVPPPAVE